LQFIGSPSFVALLLMRKPDGLFLEMRATRIAGPGHYFRASKETIMKSIRYLLSSNLTVLALAWVAACQPAIAQSCGLEDLGTLAGSTDSYASAINNRGQVVGYSTIAATGFNHAFLYERGAMIDLGTLPGGNWSEAYAINDRGQVVGAASTKDAESHAFLYENGRMSDLGTLPGGVSSAAYGINNRGQVVGSSDTASGYSHAFLYEHGAMEDLGTLPGPVPDIYSGAAAINDRGQIAGSSTFARPPRDSAVLFQKGVITNIGTLTLYTSHSTGINDRGEIVGNLGESGSHAFLYRDGSLTDLGTLPGDQASAAQGINDQGQVVGFSSSGLSSRAFLYERGKMVDLGSFPGSDYSQASGINDYGQVVGVAGTASGFHAVLWHTLEDGYRHEGRDKCHDDKHDDDR
jgi:probable HAF family extracellular repeat protein